MVLAMESSMVKSANGAQRIERTCNESKMISVYLVWNFVDSINRLFLLLAVGLL